jgi:hypothetical protein
VPISRHPNVSIQYCCTFDPRSSTVRHTLNQKDLKLMGYSKLQQQNSSFLHCTAFLFSSAVRGFFYIHCRVASCSSFSLCTCYSTSHVTNRLCFATYFLRQPSLFSFLKCLCSLLIFFMIHAFNIPHTISHILFSSSN